MQGFSTEYERRCYAVKRVKDDGRSVVSAAREVGRTEQWLHKWLRRFEAEGGEGLKDRSRAPRRRPGALPVTVTAKVLEVRDLLEQAEFANRGAEAIRYQLAVEAFQPLPSLSTIERVLRRAGRTGPQQLGRGSGRPRWSPSVDRPGIWQQADWVGPRWLGPRISFSSLNVVDVGGGGAWADQHPQQRLVSALGALTDTAWPRLGVPFHLQVDGAFCMQSPLQQRNPFNVFVRGCLLFGTEVVIAPPHELGWQNHVESFNGLWQDRTLRRHRYDSVEAMKASSVRFCSYYLFQRPSPRLSVKRHGTRYPGVLLTTHTDRLRFPPEGFRLGDYQDRRGRVHLPLGRGRLTYLCRVQPGGVIDVAKAPFFVPTSTQGQVVAATILTSRRQLVVRLGHEIIAIHRFPISDKPIAPYHPIARRGLYYGIQG